MKVRRIDSSSLYDRRTVELGFAVSQFNMESLHPNAFRGSQTEQGENGYF